jgi:large subunit ribosomal protein L23
MKNILLRPIITEKSMAGTSNNKYCFEVSENTNKVEIKKAAKQAYKVDAVGVNIISKLGKARNYKGRGVGRTKDWKLAVITVKKGQKIAGFEIKEEKKKK